MKEKRLLLPAASSLFFVRSEFLVKVSVGNFTYRYTEPATFAERTVNEDFSFFFGSGGRNSHGL